MIKEPIDRINTQIKIADSDLKNSESEGVNIGLRLVKETKEDIHTIKSVCDSDDYQFQILSDKLANQILQCGIVGYNSTHDDQKIYFSL